MIQGQSSINISANSIIPTKRDNIKNINQYLRISPPKTHDTELSKQYVGYQIATILYKFQFIISNKMNELSRSRRNSQNSPIVQARKRLLSLRMINPHLAGSRSSEIKDEQIFFRLEKSLAKHNLEEQPISDPSPMLPGEDQTKVEDRIWRQFIDQDSKVASKIEREKINYYQKFFVQTKKEYQGYQQARRNCIGGLQATIKEKYRQIHSYFQEIKQQKAAAALFTTTAKTNKKNKKNQPPIMDNNGKIQTLKATIEDLRKQVAEIEKQRQVLVEQQRKLYNQWTYFLKKFLKDGYYLKKGAIPILRELFQLKAKLTLQDMPKCLDDVSKRCLLEQFNRFKNTKTPELNKRVNSESQSKISTLAKKQMIRDVYMQTKQYLISLVKQSSWNEPLTLPPIKQTQKLKQTTWQDNEKKRLAHIYNGEQYERARSILFGPKVETNM